MGRQINGTQMDKKQVSVKSNSTITDSVCEAPQIAGDNIEVTEYEVKECTEENTDDCECYEKQDASSVPDGKTLEDQKPCSPASISRGFGKSNYTVPNPIMPPTEKRAYVTRTTVAYIEGSDGYCSPKATGVHSPRSIKSSQMNSPTLSRRLFRGDKKSHDDNDDCWSLTSSAAGVAKTNKSRTTITVASAPVFKCTERAEKRKEFYKKLEEKHRALEEERKQFEARIKEEQDAVLKQLRKNMTYKANPVPEFYRQGPPLKPELKRLPVTRPKSPKFNTSRRKSSSDVAASAVEENTKAPARPVRHSTGAHKQETPSSINRKIQVNGRSRVNATHPAPKTEAPNSSPPRMEHASNDIFVES